MPTPCECHERHLRRRIVLTGGPGAGKTAVLELLRQSLCQHVIILPEAAGVIFGGGFPRRDNVASRRAAQRAIYNVQRELEEAVEGDAAIVLCDRGLLDGAAYWPGPDDFWSAVGADRLQALQRYDAVIHLRVPAAAEGYDRRNPLRIESAEQARAIDDRIAAAWDGHPRRFFVDPAQDFMSKAASALTIVRQELPECCRDHVTSALHSSVAGDRSGGTV